jgi:hypothetical protein
MPDYGFNYNLGPQTKPTSLADMLNIAGAAQGLQQSMQMNPLQLQEAQQRVQQSQQMNPLLLKQQEQVVGKSGIELEQSQRVNEEQKALQKFLSKPDNWQTNGRIDIDKLNSAIPNIAPLTGGEVINKFTTLGEAQTKSIDALQKLSKEQRSLVAGPIGVLGRRGEQDPKVYIEELEHIKKTHPNQRDLHQLIDVEIDLLKNSKAGPQIAKSAIAGSQSMLAPEQQEAQFAPKTGLTDVGGQLVQTTTQPAVGGNLPTISVTGQGLNKTLPPGTQVVAGENDPYGYAPGTKYFLPTNQPQQTNKPAVSSLAPPAEAKLTSEAGAITGSANIAVNDWKQTVDAAKEAPRRIAIFQNIRKLSSEAFTGVGGQRKELAAGIANAIGIPAYEAEKTATDELAKNSNLLALVGGNTDLARQIAEAANPNKKMNEKAIKSVVGQMIGIEKLNLAKQNFLSPYQNDPVKYNQRLQEFTQFADPRIFQEMSKQEVGKLLKSMTEKERVEMDQKVRAAKMAGVM